MLILKIFSRMKFKLIFCVSMLCFVFNCNNGKRKIVGDTPFQKQLNAQYKDASRSPLKDKDRRNFKGLPFFSIDSNYVVKAALTRTPNTKWLNMKTTTSRLSKQKLYGILNFTINNTPLKLNVYQGKNTTNPSGVDDYLFLPFLDKTNGQETYSGGRYLDLDFPLEGSNTLIIDFNKAYNPYCAYNSKYSCPIVPRQNYLKIKIKAGVKLENSTLH